MDQRMEMITGRILVTDTTLTTLSNTVNQQKRETLEQMAKMKSEWGPAVVDKTKTSI